jgi:hypothetical protein
MGSAQELMIDDGNGMDDMDLTRIFSFLYEYFLFSFFCSSFRSFQSRSFGCTLPYGLALSAFACRCLLLVT